MSLGNPMKGPEKPELIDLPVYRETFISQKWVDELCLMLWNAGEFK